MEQREKVETDRDENIVRGREKLEVKKLRRDKKGKGEKGRGRERKTEMKYRWKERKRE